MASPPVLLSPPTSQNGTTASQLHWTVRDVVEWAKSKGFDNSVCDKFIEHEITGDVLFELDANVLRTELGIHAYGKRWRIMKEIAGLRRPRTMTLSVQPAPSHPCSQTRMISESASLPSSAHHSLRSPMAFGATLGRESELHRDDRAATPALGAMRRDSGDSDDFDDSDAYSFVQCSFFSSSMSPNQTADDLPGLGRTIGTYFYEPAGRWAERVIGRIIGGLKLWRERRRERKTKRNE